MPLFGSFRDSLLIPVVTTSRASTGELRQSFDYTASQPVFVKLVQGGVRPVQVAPGQFLSIDATVHVPACNTSLQPVVFQAGVTGERRQVKINGEAWEVVYVKDLGGLNRVKEVALRAWR